MELEQDDLVMLSYLRSGRCWWICRVYRNDTFDIYFTSEQPSQIDIPRQRYDFSDFEKVVTVGELKDWIGGLIGQSPVTD